MLRIIKYNGQSHSISEWARIIGVPKATLRGRLVRWGDVEKALTYVRPVKRKTKVQASRSRVDDYTVELNRYHGPNGLIAWKTTGTAENHRA